MTSRKKDLRRDLLGWVTAHNNADPPEILVEGPLPGDGTWRVSALFLLREQRLVLAEIKVFPGGDRLWAVEGHLPTGHLVDPRDAHPALAPGQWSQSTRGLHGVTEGGVTTSRLRDVPVVQLRERAQDFLRKHKDWSPEPGDWNAGRTVGTAWGRALRDAPERPGRAGRPDSYYVVTAARYVELLNAGDKRPLQTMADESGRKPTQIRDVLSRARSKEFLTSRPGAAEGVLTPRALAVLKSLEEPPATRKRKP
ncbi:MAG: hypothetical protein JWM02_3518 [Frankiales bacterium]|nr:hypothetical protein [Frankiales bacterium]